MKPHSLVFPPCAQHSSLVYLGRRSRTKSDLSMKMYEEEIQVRNSRNTSAYNNSNLVRHNLLNSSTPCFYRSGMQSIRGKTFLSQTKAWSRILTVLSLTRLPFQSLSSTHRLDLKALTNSQFASSTHTPSSQPFLMLRNPHHSGSFPVPSCSPIVTVGN